MTILQHKKRKTMHRRVSVSYPGYSTTKCGIMIGKIYHNKDLYDTLPGAEIDVNDPLCKICFPR